MAKDFCSLVSGLAGRSIKDFGLDGMSWGVRDEVNRLHSGWFLH